MNTVHCVLLFFLVVYCDFHTTAEEAVINTTEAYNPLSEIVQESNQSVPQPVLGINQLETSRQTLHVQDTYPQNVRPQQPAHPDPEDVDYTGEEFQDNRLRLMYPGRLITLNETELRTWEPGAFPAQETMSHMPIGVRSFRNDNSNDTDTDLPKQETSKDNANVSVVIQNKDFDSGWKESNEKSKLNVVEPFTWAADNVTKPAGKLLYAMTLGNSTGESIATVLLPNGTVVSHKESHNSTTMHEKISDDGVIFLEKFQNKSMAPNASNASIPGEMLQISKLLPIVSKEFLSKTTTQPILVMNSTGTSKNPSQGIEFSKETVSTTARTTTTTVTSDKTFLNTTGSPATGKGSTESSTFEETFPEAVEIEDVEDEVFPKTTGSINFENTKTTTEIPNSASMNTTQSSASKKITTAQDLFTDKVPSRTTVFITGNSSMTEILLTENTSPNKTNTMIAGNGVTTESPFTEGVSPGKKITPATRKPATKTQFSGRSTTTESSVSGRNTTEGSFSGKPISDAADNAIAEKTHSKTTEDQIPAKNVTAAPPQNIEETDNGKDTAYEEILSDDLPDDDDDDDEKILNNDITEDGPVVILLPGDETNQGKELIPANASLQGKQPTQIMADKLLHLLVNLTTITNISEKNGRRILKELGKQKQEIQKLQKQSDTIYQYIMNAKIEQSD